MTTHKIRVKIGDAEFDAEGTPEDVKAQYEAFLSLLKQAPASPQPPKPIRLEFETDPDSGENPLMARIFNLGKDGVVSLKVLPKGNERERDALLLLLYGYRKMKGEENIFATQLMKAARVSGLVLDRLDRVMDGNSSYVIRGGLRRSATYTLNNQGVIAAEALMPKIFE